MPSKKLRDCPALKGRLQDVGARRKAARDSAAEQLEAGKLLRKKAQGGDLATVARIVKAQADGPSKMHIDELCGLVHTFFADILAAMKAGSLRQQRAAADAARDNLRTRLGPLSDMIDWTNHD